MPSASSKTEKPASAEAVDPLKQAIVIIGHKIRNLEKRKSKLDSYKESINSLTKEQVEAVSKYDEVIQQLELSKEYVKQFTVISVENDKSKKKQAKKDAQDKFVAETNKIKLVLQIQDILENMGVKNAQEDFLAGKNGAIQLTEADLKVLDDLSSEISKKNASSDNTSGENDHFQKVAEIFMSIIDGKTKEIAGSTGAKLRDLPSMEEGKFLNKQDELAPEEFSENKDVLSNVIVPTQNSSEGNHPPVQNAAPMQTIMPGNPILPGNQPLMQPNQHPVLPPNVTNIVPTPVSQVESSFFNAQGFKPPAPPNVPPSNQNARQINDVIQSVAGKFNFLQESELELTDLNSVVIPGNPQMAAPQMPGAAPTIPTQTFTNQNFNEQHGNTPSFPTNYPPQPTAFQTFVPAFPAFVAPNSSPFENSQPANPNSGNPAPVPPVSNSGNPNMTTTSNINGSNKCNSIPNSVPVATNRNPNLNFNQGKQQISSNYPNQPPKQNLSQAVGQSAFPHNSIPVNKVETGKKIEDVVRVDNDMKEKQEAEKQDWSQPGSTSWADDWTETSDWNPITPNQPDGNTNSNKFSSGRSNRNPGSIPRSTNGYQGNRNRTNRPGAYRDSQNNQGGGSSNYYQNGYQSRNDRNNEYSVGKGADLRDNTFRERNDYINRDGYGGGFKRGPNNRGPNMKGPMDRSDKPPMQIPRNNPGGPRVPRNMNRQPGGRNGPSFQRQQPVPLGAAVAK
ncbi:hypothetical protein RUM43_014274 [Polyplax serrata]|uniref:Caprin-1 dimerization domain-containing protein n=1 Tax=Polyplax serrata TaxID=468196 RepID=A0AAN8PR18_POLSC